MRSSESNDSSAKTCKFQIEPKMMILAAMTHPRGPRCLFFFPVVIVSVSHFIILPSL